MTQPKPCGCQISKDVLDSYGSIIYCPLHAAAEKMLKTLKKVQADGFEVDWKLIDRTIAAVEKGSK